MNINQIREIFSQPDQLKENAFEVAVNISRLCHDARTESVGRELVIRALENHEGFMQLNGVLDSLARQVGLFPYVNPENLSTVDQLAYEYHKPLDNFEGLGPIVFHREQAEVYRSLMNGESYVLSAPTSFGKSLIIDALISSGKFNDIMIIVPTIALIDETRRRMSRFSRKFKVITHPSQTKSDSNIFVLTQERAIDRDDVEKLDLLVIDEFYKLDLKSSDDGDRAAILNHALYKINKISRQVYLLGPNIRGIPDEFGDKFNSRIKISEYNTVVSEVISVSPLPSREVAFVKLCQTLEDPTLVYCRSPKQANDVVNMLSNSIDGIASDKSLLEASDWLATFFHPDWSVCSALESGIGIHHGRIPRALAHLNVRLFNDGKLKFLVCTSSLIEGVNTVAKNVIIYEGKIGRPRIDFFTFQNIRGRSGRMFKHFVGRVFVLDAPPERELDIVDVPVLTQGDNAPLGLLLQIDDGDLSEQSQERLSAIMHQTALPTGLLKANSHIDPLRQLYAADQLQNGGRTLHRLLSWRGWPDWEELLATCELIYDAFVQRPASGVFSGRQLAFRLNSLSKTNSIREFIENLLENDNRIEDANDAVETAFLFQRNWASFAFPRYLKALERIQGYVYSRAHLTVGDYSPYAAQVENLFSPQEISALEEYGVPMQIGTRLGGAIVTGEGLDAAIHSLRELNLSEVEVTDFERSVLEDAQLAL